MRVRFTSDFDYVKRAPKGGVTGMVSYKKGTEDDVPDAHGTAAIEAGKAEAVGGKDVSKSTAGSGGVEGDGKK